MMSAQHSFKPKTKDLKGELMIWRTKMQARVRFNSRIQFASNEYKLALTNLDPQPL